MRTKTSGPGKPVKSLQFYVSKDCWIDEPYWLQIGWELWEALGKEAGLADRDFLLPVPGSSLESLTRKVTSYADASTLAKALLSNLPSDETGDELLRPGLAAFLTEHSERASLRSWASAASVSSATSRRKRFATVILLLLGHTVVGTYVDNGTPLEANRELLLPHGRHCREISGFGDSF